MGIEGFSSSSPTIDINDFSVKGDFISNPQAKDMIFAHQQQQQQIGNQNDNAGGRSSSNFYANNQNSSSFGRESKTSVWKGKVLSFIERKPWFSKF